MLVLGNVCAAEGRARPFQDPGSCSIREDVRGLVLGDVTEHSFPSKKKKVPHLGLVHWKGSRIPW